MKDYTNTNFFYPKWCNDLCASSNIKISDTKKIRVKFKVKKDDTVSINLLGPDVKKDGVRIHVKVLYKDFVVNNKTIFSKPVQVWHDNQYKHPMNLRAGQIVEFSVVPTISRFSFYKFVMSFSVLLMFLFVIEKFVRHKESKIDAFFIVLLILFLFIPMSYISNVEKSEQENRVLANKPTIIVDNKINEKYGTQFDAWFNDRFNGRNLLINIYKTLAYQLNGVYQNDKALFIKNTDWMFLKRNYGYKKDINGIVKNLKELDSFCKQHNMKLYILIVPEKEMIYSNILEQDYGINHKDVDDFNKYIYEVQNTFSNNIIIYPYQELMDAKETDYVFFKQSHHWTDWGAYNGYKVLANRIKKDFKDFMLVSLDDYDKSFSNKIRDDWGREYGIGQTSKMLNLQNNANKLLKTQYSYYDNKDKTIIKETRSKYTKVFENNDKKAKYKVFLTGNSQNEDLLQFLPYSVKSLKYLRLNKGQQSDSNQWKFMKYYKQELLDYKPDILILSTSAVMLQALLTNFYKD